MSTLRYRVVGRPGASALVERIRARQAPPAISVVMALLAAGWSAAVLDQRVLGATLPGPGNLAKVLPYLMPGLLLASLLVRRRSTSWLDEAVTIWVTLVLLAVLLLPSLTQGSVTPLAIPLIALSAAAARRWPVQGMFLVALFSASFGSLHAFWNFPVEKAIGLVLAALWVASLTGLLMRGSRPVRLSLGLVLLGAYLLITAVQVMLASDRSVAESGFKDGGWFMLVVLLIAYAGWDRDALQRIARGLLVVAALAGAYAVYRIIAGPALAEYQLFATTAFNFVNGKLKPGGSFGNAQDMGTWMAAIVPFCFAAILTQRGRWRRLAVVACGLCTVAAIESQTRVALVGLACGLLLVLALYEGSRSFPGLRLSTTAVATLVGVALVVGGVALTGDNSSHSFKGLLHPTSDPSFVARKYKWTQALHDLDTHPFGYGVGVASYAGETSGQSFFQAGDTTVDNGFLKIALEQGLVIMGLFAVAVLSILLALIRGALRETEPGSAGIAIGAAGTVVSFLIVMVAEDATANPRSLATWMIVGLGMAVVVGRPAQRRGAGTLSVAAEAAGRKNR
jgi:hypothetical protein